MEMRANPDELITCPYDVAHQIRRCRMGVHLVKCKKNFPKVKMVTCDFNATHKIPEPEIQYHHETCAYRMNVEIALYKESGAALDKFPVQNVPVATEESWDDFDCPSYNPSEYCLKNNIVRQLNTESAAKRKDFRQAERERLNDLTFQANASAVQRNLSLPVATAKTPVQSVPQATTSRQREFPQPKNVAVQEETTPDSIAEIMDRIKIGSNRPYTQQTQQQKQKKPSK